MKGELSPLLQSGWCTGTHQLSERGSQPLGLGVLHWDEVSLGELLHIDSLHLALLAKDIERMLLQGPGLHLRFNTASVAAACIGCSSSPSSCQAVLTSKAGLVLEAGKREPASKGSSTFPSCKIYLT